MAMLTRYSGVRSAIAILGLLAFDPNIAAARTTNPGLAACLSNKTEPLVRVASCSAVLGDPQGGAFRARALNARALASMALGDNAGAVRDMTQLIASAPKVAAYYDTRQAAFRGLGNLDAALDDASTAVALAPDHAFVHHSRASVLVQMGRPEEALTEYRRAIEIDPGPAFRYYDAAAALSSLGRYEDAVEMLGRGLAINPQADELLKARGLALLSLGRRDDAMADLTVYRAHRPDDQTIDAALTTLQAPSGPPRSVLPDPAGSLTVNGSAPPRIAESRSFGSFRVDASRPTVISMNGPIDEGTPLDFRRALAADPGVQTLELNSPGGLVTMGLIIADDVFKRRLATVIPAGEQCFSACSFIFFAGSSRTAIGQLGVHQISNGNDLQDAQLRISDILDELTQFGTPAAVFPIMFRTPPNDIHVFSPDEITSIGINRAGSSTLPPASPKRPAAWVPTVVPQSPPQYAGSGSQPVDGDETRARAYLMTYLEAWSKDNATALAFMSSAYEGSVMYYGAPKSGPSVFAEKRQFSRRWPIRSYRLHTPDVAVHCADRRCVIDTLVDWSASSPERHKTSTGVAELTLTWNSNTNRLASENGRVLKGMTPNQ